MHPHTGDTPGPQVVLRDVRDEGVPVCFEHQSDPEATAMVGLPARDGESHTALCDHPAGRHGRRRTMLADGQVARNIVSWDDAGRRMVGYWIGRYWGHGVATRALVAFLRQVETWPLHPDARHCPPGRCNRRGGGVVGAAAAMICG